MTLSLGSGRLESTGAPHIDIGRELGSYMCVRDDRLFRRLYAKTGTRTT